MVLLPMPQELQREGRHNLREHEDSAPEVVSGDVPHRLPQEGNLVTPAGEGHRCHTEDGRPKPSDRKHDPEIWGDFLDLELDQLK